MISIASVLVFFCRIFTTPAYAALDRRDTSHSDGSLDQSRPAARRAPLSSRAKRRPRCCGEKSKESCSSLLGGLHEARRCRHVVDRLRGGEARDRELAIVPNAGGTSRRLFSAGHPTNRKEERFRRHHETEPPSSSA